jgi:hypothetical protein
MQAPKKLSFAYALCVGTVVAACTSQPVIVADPPQHTHNSPEEIPWEEEYARMRPKSEVFEEDGAGEETQAFNGGLEHSSEEESGFVQVVADVISFPFRGVGWVLQKIF